jgi:hypothetical protein
MEEAHMGIAVPFVGLLLILGTLLLFGIAWMFHHHFWKPVVGGLLFVVGLAVLVMFGWVASPHHMVQEAYAPKSVDRYPDDELRGVSTAPQPPGAARTTLETPRGSGHSDHLGSGTRAKTDGGSDVAEATSDSVRPAKPSADVPGHESPSTDGHQRAASGKPPKWLGQSLHAETRENGQRVYVASVASGRYSSPDECERAIIPAIKEVVARFAADHVETATHEEPAFDRQYIETTLVKEWYSEPVSDSSVGPMNQLHALLVFDKQVHDDLDRIAKQAVIDVRLQEAAGIVACSLAVLGGAYMLLKRGAPPRTPTPEQVAS